MGRPCEPQVGVVYITSPEHWEVRMLLGHEAWNPFVCEWSACKRMQLMLSQMHGAAPLPWSTPNMRAAAVEV